MILVPVWVPEMRFWRFRYLERRLQSSSFVSALGPSCKLGVARGVGFARGVATI